MWWVWWVALVEMFDGFGATILVLSIGTEVCCSVIIGVRCAVLCCRDLVIPCVDKGNAGG